MPRRRSRSPDPQRACACSRDRCSGTASRLVVMVAGTMGRPSNDSDGHAPRDGSDPSASARHPVCFAHYTRKELARRHRRASRVHPDIHALKQPVTPLLHGTNQNKFQQCRELVTLLRL